jgi:hypothetical protein
MIRSLLLSLAAVAALAPAALAQAPDRSAEVRAALEALPIAPGAWEGEAWYRRGPAEPDTVLQTERVETRLDGVVLLVEGIGRSKAAGEVVHHAFATIGWDSSREAYFMTAWLADGSVIEPSISFDDGVLVWGFQPPGGPRIRYRITAPEPGVWREDGEASMDDGATWFPFFGMTLTRTGDMEE